MGAKNILDVIGHTPLIKVGRLAESVKANVWAKLEYVNPSGSHNLWRQGLFAGVSSGANGLVALQEARKCEGANVVTVLPDSADRYLTEEHYVT